MKDQALNEFNNEQLFFISYAQVKQKNFFKKNIIQKYCYKYKGDEEVLYNYDYPVPIAYARVNIGLSNLIEFSNAFKCSPNTPMDPIDKCTLW